jgi:two-component system chemotaxis sensor kinase CheA
MTGPDLLRTFEAELRKSADGIQACLLAMEGADAAEVGRSLHEAYRLTHSVKGASRVVGLTTIEEVAHVLEDRLQELVRRGGAPTEAETTTYLRVVDGFVAALEAFLRGEEYDPRPSLDALWAIGGGPASGEADAGSEEVDQESSPRDAAVPGSRGLLRREEDAATQPSPLPAEAVPQTRRDEFLRVPAHRVDELFRRVEESFLIEARVTALVARLEEEDGNGAVERQKTVPELRREANRLHQLLLGFHEVVRLMRMEPLDRLRVPLQRAARDLAPSLGKVVRFRMHGRQEMVDAAILDALQDPLLHLVRNAIDHGIEPPADREAAGKPPEGLVEIHAAVKGGVLEVAVADDGRGVAADRVRDAAVAAGIVSTEETAGWSHGQWLDLLFQAGFSTAAEVSAISGRGIGLDIVRRRLEELGGEVHLHSSPERGSRFELRVPIRLLTARTLLVQCGDHRAGLPIADVAGVFALKPGQAEQVGGRRLVRWQGEPLALEPLGGRLGWAGRAADHGHVVVVSALGGVKALLVDDVVGEVEQPAVPPPPNLAGLPLLAGVIVLGEGDVIPLLDARELVRAGAAAAAHVAPAVSFAPSAEPQGERQRVLVVDDSPTVRALHRSVLQAAGYAVLVCEDGVDALATLEQRSADLVVTDIQMPRMDGLTLIRRIRERPAWRRLPIVVVSQYGRREDLQKAAALGADRYVVKSAFKPEELVEIVAELLEQ